MTKKQTVAPPVFKLPPDVWYRMASLESDLRALLSEWRETHDDQPLSWHGTEEADDATTWFEEIEEITDKIDAVHYEPGDPSDDYDAEYHGGGESGN